MRLVDADEMMKEAVYHHEHCGLSTLWTWDEVVQLINNTPTAQRKESDNDMV